MLDHKIKKNVKLSLPGPTKLQLAGTEDNAGETGAAEKVVKHPTNYFRQFFL